MRLLTSNNTRAWILIVFGFKLLTFLLFASLSKGDSLISEYGVNITNDFSELLGPVENYLESGTYSLEKNSDKPYAGRLPGYSIPYLLIRLLVDKELALLMLILFQLLLSSWASVAVSSTISRLSRQHWVFFVGIIGLSVFSYHLPWEVWAYPESFALSAWLLSVHFLERALTRWQWYFFLISGFFLAWTFFLRGFLGVYFVAVGLVLFVLWMRSTIKWILIKRVLVFLIPLLLFESAWVIRNKISLGQPLLLQTSFGWSELEDDYPLDMVYKPSMLELRKLIASWGGDNVHFYPGSDMSYFTMKSSPGEFFPFDEDIFFEGFQPDSLLKVRALVQSSLDKSLPNSERLLADAKLAATAERFTKEFRRRNPFTTYAVAPILRLKNLVVRNVVGNWPGPSFSASPIWYKAWKVAVLAWYYGSIGFGLMMAFLFIFRSRDNQIASVLILATILLAITFMFIINTAEFKYFMTGAVNLWLISLLGTAKLLFLRNQKDHSIHD